MYSSYVRSIFADLLTFCFVLINGHGSVASAEVDLYKIDTSVQGIIGTWHEADVLDSRTLIVKPDYTYELSYKGGGTAYGTVRVTAEEHPDGSYTPWYMFEESDGKLWAGFAKNDLDGTLQTELWSGQDGAMHFVRPEKQGNYGNGEGVSPKDYLGVWACGRCTIVINQQDNAYIADITWANSAAEHRVWTYNCRYDKDNAILVCPGNAICTDCIVYENGKENDITAYSDGSCEFVMREGILRWHDFKENAGDEMDFRR